MFLTNRKKLNNNEYKYTNYISLLFQMIIIPIYFIYYLHYDYIYINIIYICIHYFLSDIPELIYNKNYKYIIHHIISISILYVCTFANSNIKNNIIYNICLLKLGSSTLSITSIFNYKYIYRPYIFFISRIFAIINTINILIINNYSIKINILLCILSFSLIFHNYYIFNNLIKKNIFYKKK